MSSMNRRGCLGWISGLAAAIGLPPAVSLKGSSDQAGIVEDSKFCVEYHFHYTIQPLLCGRHGRDGGYVRGNSYVQTLENILLSPYRKYLSMDVSKRHRGDSVCLTFIGLKMTDKLIDDLYFLNYPENAIDREMRFQGTFMEWQKTNGSSREAALNQGWEMVRIGVPIRHATIYRKWDLRDPYVAPAPDPYEYVMEKRLKKGSSQKAES